MGERKVGAPVAFGRVTTNFGRDARHKIFRFDNVEYLVAFTGSTTSHISAPYYWQPADTSIFPILGQLAGVFGEYRWRKLRLIGKTLTNTANIGSINVATVPDIEAVALATKPDFINAYGNVESTPWLDWEHDILRVGGINQLKWYGITSSNGVPPGADADYHSYDMSFTQIAAFGNADTKNVCDVYVDYDVEFRNIRSASLTATIEPKQEPSNLTMRCTTGIDGSHALGAVASQVSKCSRQYANPSTGLNENVWTTDANTIYGADDVFAIDPQTGASKSWFLLCLLYRGTLVTGVPIVASTDVSFQNILGSSAFDVFTASATAAVRVFNISNPRSATHFNITAPAATALSGVDVMVCEFMFSSGFTHVPKSRGEFLDALSKNEGLVDQLLPYLMLLQDTVSVPPPLTGNRDRIVVSADDEKKQPVVKRSSLLSYF